MFNLFVAGMCAACAVWDVMTGSIGWALLMMAMTLINLVLGLRR